MKSLTCILLLCALLFSNTLKKETIAEANLKRRAVWTSISGTVEKVGRKLYLSDSTGRVRLKVIRTGRDTENSLYSTLENGALINIIGTVAPSKRDPYIRMLHVSQDEQTLFRQEFRNISIHTDFPPALTDTELNRLIYEYKMSYQKKAIVNHSVGITAGVISSLFIISALDYEPSEGGFMPDFTGAIYLCVGMGFLHTTIRHTLAGSLFRRRKRLAPEYERESLSMSLQVLPSKDDIGLYLVGRL